MHCTCRGLLNSLLASPSTRNPTLPASFLLPAFKTTHTASFTSSTTHLAHKDGNPRRGVSALRRTGPGKKQKLSVRLANLPQPVRDPQKRSKVEVDDDHGLWGFFNTDRTALLTPEEYNAHGRGWTVPELRIKDWDDLHRLWWVCVKERNRIATYEAERKRLRAGYGDYEAQGRVEEIKKTQKAIKHVLTERWYTWQSARELAMQDDEVNLSAEPGGSEPAYVPNSSEEGDAGETEGPYAREDNYSEQVLPSNSPVQSGEARL